MKRSETITLEPGPFDFTCVAIAFIKRDCLGKNPICTELDSYFDRHNKTYGTDEEAEFLFSLFNITGFENDVNRSCQANMPISGYAICE